MKQLSGFNILMQDMDGKSFMFLGLSKISFDKTMLNKNVMKL
jgi:hypothetical protein